MNVQALNQVGDAPAVARLRNAITENPAIGRWRRVPKKEGFAAQVLDGAYFAFLGLLWSIGWPDRTAPRIAGHLEFAPAILPLYGARQAENG